MTGDSSGGGGKGRAGSSGAAARARRGKMWEARTAEDLRADGYAVWLSPGSHTPADLIALKQGQILLCQVKRTSRSAPTMSALITHDEWNDLLTIAQHAGGIPLLIAWTGRAMADRQILRITGPHLDGSTTWPCVPFTVDEAGSGDGGTDVPPVRGGQA